MTDTELRELLKRHLGEHYGKTIGQILYSGIETLRKGKYYIVGLNPRPDNSNRELEKIPVGLTRWSAYTCQCWKQKHTHHKQHPAFLHCGNREHHHADADAKPCDGAGDEFHQKRVFGMLEQLTEGTELSSYDVFATNMYFVETKNTKRLRAYRTDFAKYWELHRRFLREVKPEYIICLGYGDGFTAFTLMRQQAKEATAVFSTEAPHKWNDGLPYIRWFNAKYRLDDESTHCAKVVGIYHPSYRPSPPRPRDLMENYIV